MIKGGFSHYLLTTIFLFLQGVSVTCLAQTEDQQLKVGLVLSGGGAKGFAHIGVLQVLENNDIPIHLIGGTSMGAVSGALYSLGYPLDKIEYLINTTDWADKFDEASGRRPMSMENKLRDGKYVLTLPLRNRRKVGLPTGFAEGQKVSAMLNNLMWPAIGIYDFDDLPIPFVAVATDIETGVAVPFRSGYLPDVIRASMAVPTLLTPVELDGRLLVDGAAIRNLPAEDVAALGADYLICADVSSDLSNRDELKSALDVVVQAASFQMFVSNGIQRKYCDVLIRPKLVGKGILDFSSPQEIIEEGRISARELVEDIKHDLTAKGIELANFRRSLLARVDSVLIEDTIVEGLQEIPVSVVRSQIETLNNSWQSKIALEEEVERIFSTGFFKLVTYELRPMNLGYRMVIKVKEKKEDNLRIGFRFDDREKASLLANATYWNVGLRGSKWLLDARLGERFYLASEYLVGLGIKNRFGFQFIAILDDRIQDLFLDRERTSTWNIRTYSAELALSTLYAKSVLIGAGVRKELSVVSPIVAPGGLGSFDNSPFIGFVKLWFDTLDRSYFPSSGNLLQIESDKSSDQFLSDVNMTRHSLTFAHISNFAPKWVAESRMEVVRSSQTTPSNYLPTLGGVSFSILKRGRFAGASHDELSGHVTKTAWTSIRLEFRESRFLTAGVQMGNGFRDWEWDITSEEYEKSAFASIGALTPIGPVNLTVSSGTVNRHKVDFSLGFVF